MKYLLLFISCCVSAGVLEALQSLQGNSCLVYGTGIGRSYEQVIEEGAGNPMELTLALRGEVSCPTETYIGDIAFSKKQQIAWGGDECEQIAWLGVQLLCVPVFAKQDNADGAIGWIDVFPCLTGRRRIKSTLATYVYDGQALSLLHAMNAGSLTAVDEQIKEILSDFALRYDVSEIYEKSPETFPGYANPNGLTTSPVKVLSRRKSALPLSYVYITVLGKRDEILLEYNALQSELTGEQIRLENENDEIKLIVAEDCVAGVASEEEMLTLCVERKVDGHTSDFFEYVVSENESCDLAISSGTTIQKGKKLSETQKIRSTQDRISRLITAVFDVMERRQLFVTCGTQNLKNKMFDDSRLWQRIEDVLNGEIENPCGCIECLYPIVRLCRAINEQEYAQKLQGECTFYILHRAVEIIEDAPEVQNFSLNTYDAGISCSEIEIDFDLKNAQNWVLRIENETGQSLSEYSGSDWRTSFCYPLNNENGILTFVLTAYGSELQNTQRRYLVRDTVAPKVDIIAKQAAIGNNTFIHIDAKIDDKSPDGYELLVSDEGGQVLFCSSGAGLVVSEWIPVDSDGQFTIDMRAWDKCGNTTEFTQKVEIAHVLSPENCAPGVKIEILNLNDARRLVSLPFSAICYAMGFSSIDRLEMYLDGMLVGEANNSLVLKTDLDTENWECMRHVLQAVAYDDAGNAYYSKEIVFYYTTFGADAFCPEINIELNRFPVCIGDEVSVLASDNDELYNISVHQNGLLLESKVYNSQQGKLNVSVNNLSEPLEIVAGDVSGNIAYRKINLEREEESVFLQMTSEAFDGNEYDGDVNIYVLSENVACVVLLLNGIEYKTVYFPENGCTVFTVSAGDLCDGKNDVQCIAYGKSATALCRENGRILSPVVRNLRVEPRIVIPEIETVPTVTVSAEMRQPHEWFVSLESTDFVASGINGDISAEFDVSQLSDGEYVLDVSVPELDYVRRIPIIVDIEPGKLLANITYPIEGMCVKEGVLRIKGSACTTDAATDVRYSVSLKNAQGIEYVLVEKSDKDEWQLSAKTQDNTAENIRVWRKLSVLEGTLAAIDLSSLPNGTYTLDLLVEHKGEVVSAECSFFLDSALKTGAFSFTENDFAVQIGSMSVQLKRMYSTMNAEQNGEMGYGWKQTLLLKQPEINELRTNMETEDGGRCSVRVGGTRDIAVTTASGKDLLFRFSLEEGGGYSFCYYAKWTAVGEQAELVPNCSNKLMTLPGMDPYWEASGPNTPWEKYDFPSFTMTDADGNTYLIEREHLGTAFILNGEDYAYVDAYGKMFISQIILSNGRILQFSEGNVQVMDSDDALHNVVQFYYDDKNRIVNAIGDNSHFAYYEYDNRGNLARVMDENWRVTRSYEYGNVAFPHHITAVKDGNGTLVAALQYDSNGQLIASAGGDGVFRHNETDVFAGYDVQTDELGRKTLLQFDEMGNVTSKISPDGAEIKYHYDDKGNEIAFTDALGNTGTRQFENGRVVQKTSASGTEVRYHYIGEKCVAIVDENGLTTTYSYDDSGNVTSILTPGGNLLQMAYDENGRICERSLNGNDKLYTTYNEQGRIASITSENGIHYDYQYDEDGHQTYRSVTLFHPVSGEEITGASVWEYNEKGKCIFMQDSEGKWARYSYDDKGRRIGSTDCTGKTQTIRRDVKGRIVEIVENGTLVKRFGYDAAGQNIFETELTQCAQYASSMVFPRVKRYQYDAGGRIAIVEILNNSEITLCETGNNAYVADMRKTGQVLSCETSQFDKAGREIRKISREGQVTSFEYNSDGKLVSSTDTFGNKTEYVFNAKGQMSSQSNAVGGKSLFEYDRYGNVSAITFPDGAVWKMESDSKGHLLKKIQPDGVETLFERNVRGRVTTVKMPEINGNPHSYKYRYDALGTLCSVEMPGEQCITYENDEHGRREKVRMPNGDVSFYVYDDAGPMPSVYTDFMENKHIYSYDATCNIKSHAIYDALSVLSSKYDYSYNELGLLTSIVLTDDGKVERCSFAYDDEHRMKSEDIAGKKIEYRYDLDGRVTEIKAPSGGIVMQYSKTIPECTIAWAGEEGMHQTNNCKIKYDALGQVGECIRTDGGKRRITRDMAGHIVEITELSSTAQPICSLKYEYDSCSRIVSCNEEWTDGFVRRQRFVYDAWSRLIKEISISNNECADYEIEWKYDANGNTLEEITSNSIGAEKKAYEYDVNDRIKKCQIVKHDGTTESIVFNWNKNGQLLNMVSENGMLRSFEWDASGRLHRVANGGGLSVQYNYDGRGLLTSRNNSGNETDYLFMGQGERGVPQLLAVNDKTLISVGGKLLSNVADVDTQYITDAIGSVIGCFHGNDKSHIIYNARGKLLGGGHSELGYCGEIHDQQTGLVYLRSRYYMPELGIFISPDIAEPELELPQSINKYVYCRNNPVNNTDPQGTMGIGMMFSMSVLASLTLGFTIINDIAIDYSRLFYEENMNNVINQKKEKDNATIIVHGVAVHNTGYADEDFVPEMKQMTWNQDYYQLLWSGFAIYFLHFPNEYEHFVALESLFFDIEVLRNRGYETLNMISHSWGTVVTKDVFRGFANDIPHFGLWSTMGSPLTIPEYWLNADNPNIIYNHLDRWFNFFIKTDPVIYLRMAHPGVGMLKYQLSYQPLFTSQTPKQIHLDPVYSISAHTEYWTHPIVISWNSLVLNLQL